MASDAMQSVTGSSESRTWFSVAGRVVAAGAGALAAVVLVVLSARTIGDDAWITADYARTLVEHHNWGLVPGRWANTATSPLNVWLLAAGYSATGSILVAFGAVLALALGASAWWVHELASTIGVSPPAAVASTMALLVTSPLLVATLGLETYLGVAVLVGILRYGVSDRVAPVGVLCGVSLLVRPDLLAPVAVAAVGLLGLRAAVRVAAYAVVVAAPWYMWAWVVLGGLVPDTLFFKSGGSPGALLGAVVTFWFVRMPISTVLSVLLVVAGLAATVAARRRRTRLEQVVWWSMLAGCAHLIALSVIGTGPQLWYYGPAIACAALAVGISTARHPRTATVVVAAFATLSLVAAGGGGVPWWAASMNSNWAVSSDYIRIGEEVGAIVGPSTVHAPGEIGALAYACRCDIVDQFASPALAEVVIGPRVAEGGARAAVYRVSTVFRDPSATPTVRYRMLYQFPPAADPPHLVASWIVTAPQSRTPLRIVLVTEP